VRVGATGDGDALALQILDLRDGRVLAGDERGPFRPRIDVDRLDRIAVDLGDERSRASARAKIDRAGVEELERLVGAERLHPADADAVLGEFFLEEAFVLQQHRHRIVGRPVDIDGLGLVRTEARGRQQANEEHGCKPTAPNRAALRQAGLGLGLDRH
jgi:hypothetical protein